MSTALYALPTSPGWPILTLIVVVSMLELSKINLCWVVCGALTPNLELKNVPSYTSISSNTYFPLASLRIEVISSGRENL